MLCLLLKYKQKGSKTGSKECHVTWNVQYISRVAGLSAADRASLVFELVKMDVSANGCFE